MTDTANQDYLDLLFQLLALNPQDKEIRASIEAVMCGRLRAYARHKSGPAQRDMTGKAVDHIDGDPFNNDPANLRIVSLKENRRSA